MSIARALISVSDKRGIVEFAGELAGLGIEILSTGGTATRLRSAGIECRDVADVTGAPEILGGRVKTLHPRIHGGILSQPQKESHVATLEQEGIDRIDMVIVNLYAFERVTATNGTTLDEALEEIDIGGVTLLRAAAKNHENVVVVSSPDQYDAILKTMKENEGDVPSEARLQLAVDAFARTRDYDRAIHSYLACAGEGASTLPCFVILEYEKVQDLRYGENPHQNAAFYHSRPRSPSPGVPNSEQLSGKELSYNNIMDLDAALAVVREFDEPAAAVIKHATPCGVATAATLDRAYERALACDPMSAFGSVIALNRSVDLATAELIHETRFVEAVIAPDYYRNALELIRGKKNRRIVRAPFPDVMEYHLKPERHLRSLGAGGLLLQDLDVDIFEKADLRTVTEREATPEELHSLLFGWRVVKHVRSNAIVLVTGTETVGIGAGQMSRVDASILAVWKAGERVKGSVMASDAFFPMRDAVDAAAEAGVTAIIQPGGSKGDPDVIKAANERQIAMIMTGQRHFKH